MNFELREKETTSLCVCPADPCIGAYGLEAGYDHLLLDEAEYRTRIADREFFEKSTGSPDLGFWADNDQFSFAPAAAYIASFRRRFEIDYVAGLEFRARFPRKWKLLRDAGISEADLLVKGLTMVMRKPLGEGRIE